MAGDAAALARLLARHRGLDAVREHLSARKDPASARLLGLLDRHREGVAAILRILASPLDAAGSGDVAEELERCRALFDWAVGVNPQASVAFASLGDAEHLAAVTHEIVVLIDGLGMLGPDRDMLDFGCGIGRLAEALAPRLRSVTGTDLSPMMIEEAGRRCAAHANVRFRLASGRDLAGLRDRSFDLVLAVDSLPYVHRAGGAALLEAMLAEMRRVLRDDGEVLILNLTYRGDIEADRDDLLDIGGRQGLALTEVRPLPLQRWDGSLLRVRRV